MTTRKDEKRGVAAQFRNALKSTLRQEAERRGVSRKRADLCAHFVFDTWTSEGREKGEAAFEAVLTAWEAGR